METNLFSGLSQHACTRMQQRGISQDALCRLLDYGREAHGHDGSVTVYFDKEARRRLERDAGTETRKQLTRLARLYAVLGGDGGVVTVGHRYRRLKRA
jgi:hypothetical protein